MGALVGLLAGAGLLLAWSAFFVPRAPRAASTGPARTRLLLDSAGLAHVGVQSFWLMSGAAALLVAVLMQALTTTPPVALVFGAIAGGVPWFTVAGRGRRRQREFAMVWPEVVDSLASGVRAGLSLPEAVSALGERGPEVLRPAFAEFSRDYRATGRFGPALDRLKARLADPVGDRVVEGLRIAREVGGGELGRMLRNLSAHLRDDERIRAELESRQAWTVNGARLAVAAPWVVLLMMALRSDAIATFGSPAGTLVLLGGAFSCLVAYRLMMRIGRLPVERRILG